MCVFVLNISSEWAAHYFALRSQTPLLSNRAADVTLTELHFSQVLVPAGIFVMATGQPLPQKQFIIVVWLLSYFLSMQQAQYSIYDKLHELCWCLLLVYMTLKSFQTVLMM